MVNPVGPVTQASHEFLSGLTKEIQRVVPGVDDSAYLGYVDAELVDPGKAYWVGNGERLVKIKGLYDPDDVFRNPQSVPSQFEGRRGGEHRSLDEVKRRGGMLNGLERRSEGGSDGENAQRHVRKHTR